MANAYAGLSGSFREQLEQFSESTMARADEVFRSIVIQVGESVVSLSPVLTGQFKGAWRFSVGSADSSVPVTPDPDGRSTISAIVSGAQSLSYGQAAYIANNLPYAIALEYGYSNKAPSGIVRVTQQRFEQIVRRAIAENAE